MNSSNFKKKRLIYIILIIVAIILLLCGFYHIYKINKYVKNGDEIKAYVENILEYPDQNSESYEEDVKRYNQLLKYYKDAKIIDEHAAIAIIIVYTHNGEEITTDLEYFSPTIEIGQFVTIYVNPENSLDFIYKNENKFGLYFSMIAGTILLVGSLALFIIDAYNRKCDIQLFKEGKVIEAEIIYADEQENKTMFGRHPFVFTCMYKEPETNEEIIFTSEGIYCKDNGINYIGKKIKIYVDPKDITNYFIDSKQFEIIE